MSNLGIQAYLGTWVAMLCGVRWFCFWGRLVGGIGGALGWGLVVVESGTTSVALELSCCFTLLVDVVI